jgi:hypothetical protein
MSYKIANTGWVQLAFSGAVVAGICWFHSSLQQVIWIQLVLMLVLLIIVAVPFLLNSLTGERHGQRIAAARTIRIIRRVSEDDVIADFLKTDFSNPVFDEYQATLRELVVTPSLDNVGENAKRRALLFIRHFALWKELPEDTEWFEVEIRPADLAQVRVFPRAQWRKIARGKFDIPTIAERLRTFRSHDAAGETFLSKITALRNGLRNDANADPGAVLLIGLNESEPFTILDGNHRLVAAILTSPETVQRFRFLCGLSPRMKECCWYRTNVATLFRYGTNLLANVVHNPAAELARLL